MSACLLGEKCRYDGKDKLDTKLIEKLQGCNVIPFCPEDAILGTPRETLDIVQGRVIGSKTKRDYTDLICQYAHEFLAKHPDIDLFYLKSKSPSCALQSAKAYDEQGRVVTTKAQGIFCKQMQKAYPNAKFEERSGDGGSGSKST